MSVVCWVTPQMLLRTGARPGWSQELATQFRPYRWVAGIQSLFSLPAVSQVVNILKCWKQKCSQNMKHLKVVHKHLKGQVKSLALIYELFIISFPYRL